MSRILNFEDASAVNSEPLPATGLSEPSSRLRQVALEQLPQSTSFAMFEQLGLCISNHWGFTARQL